MVGFGVVGQSFAKLILSRSADLYNQYGIKPRIVACVDNSGTAISPAGLDLQKLLQVKKAKNTVGAYEKSVTKFDPVQVVENVDAEFKPNMTEEKARELAVRAIRSAIQRDAASGDGIDVLFVTKGGPREEMIPIRTV